MKIQRFHSHIVKRGDFESFEIYVQNEGVGQIKYEMVRNHTECGRKVFKVLLRKVFIKFRKV